jgi:hypothetical protein
MTNEQDIVEFTLTAGEFVRLSETLIAILNNHRDDDIGIVTITMERSDPDLTVLVHEYDGNAPEDPPLARYVVDCLALRDDFAPLKRTDLRPHSE